MRSGAWKSNRSSRYQRTVSDTRMQNGLGCEISASASSQLLLRADVGGNCRHDRNLRASRASISTAQTPAPRGQHRQPPTSTPGPAARNLDRRLDVAQLVGDRGGIALEVRDQRDRAITRPCCIDARGSSKRSSWNSVVALQPCMRDLATGLRRLALSSNRKTQHSPSPIVGELLRILMIHTSHFHPRSLRFSRVSKNLPSVAAYGWSVRSWMASMPAERNSRASRPGPGPGARRRRRACGRRRC